MYSKIYPVQMYYYYYYSMNNFYLIEIDEDHRVDRLLHLVFNERIVFFARKELILLFITGFGVAGISFKLSGA